MSETAKFRWRVHGAYKWADGLNNEPIEDTAANVEAWKRSKIVVDHSNKAMPRWYEPLKDHPALFRQFARMPVDGNGPNPGHSMLEFVSSYGLLGVKQDRRLFPQGKVDGELAYYLYKEQELMAKAILMWDCAQNNRTDLLSQSFTWENGTLKYKSTRMAQFMSADEAKSAFGDAETLTFEENIRNDYEPFTDRLDSVSWFSDQRSREYIEEGDLIEPAKIYCARVINKQLEDELSQNMIYDVTGGNFSLYTTPKSLLAAMWLQFAQSIVEDTSFYQCEHCGKWFVPKRSTAKVCSASCRAASARAAQKATAQPQENGNV